ncbi:MAG: YbfB/YjiJ family MFS transporter [Pseudomonadota bacterium]
MIKANRFTVMLAGVCSLVVCMGLGRYAFTPMIPVMGEQAGLTESAAGWLAGWGYIGYLAGLFVVWLISNTKVKDFFFRYALFVAVIATAVMATHEHMLVWGASRFFAGTAAAAGFLFGAGLIINWLHHKGHPVRMGMYFCGLGLGIVLSGLTTEILVSVFDLHYRLMWVVMAVAAFIPLALAQFLMPLPHYEQEDTGNTTVEQNEQLIPSVRWVWLLQAAYFCAGFSNTMNATFTSLIAELQPLPDFGAKAWLFVGLAATPAPLIWEALARRISYLDALLAAFFLNAVGNLIMIGVPTLTGTIVASLLFGFSFMGIVSLTLAIVGRRYLGDASQIMARLTLGYCIAQILSPILSGIVAEKTGSFALPIIVVAGLMFAGLMLLLLLRREDTFRSGKPFFARPEISG